MSIVAPDTLDINACAREPIHLPGAIQPHGILLALTEPELRVAQASANAGDWMEGDPASLPGKTLEEALGHEAGGIIRRQIKRGGFEDRAAHVATLALGRGGAPGARFDAIAHRRDNLLILELEPATPAADLEDFPSRIIDFLRGMEGRLASTELCAVAAREVRQLSGFDRVLIYRFDAQWHGDVIAEDRNEKLPSYLGHRFPASDIPAQARELYRVNRSRLIPNVSYSPAPLLPRDNPLTHRPLDLTLSVLRSVSPVHLEYMRNMGTAASMSFSIVREGRLWGLISCHNVQPRHVGFGVRRACELVAQVLALQLAAGERQAAIEQRIELRRHASRLLASMSEVDDFVEGLVRRPDELLAIADAAGAAVITHDVCRLIGQTPSEAQVRETAAWLASARSEQQVVAIDDLPAHFPPAAAFRQVGSGLLAASISPSVGSYVLWFRPEVVATVIWAGKPQKPAVSADATNPRRLNPRNSFEAWSEVVRGTAAGWSEAQVAAVAELQADAIGIVLRKAEALAALSAELQRTNRELESFSYSVSHDLRAPFRHIVGYAELLRDGEADRLSDRGRRYAGIVIDAARDAGRLIDNLLAFSQMGRSALHFVQVDLNLLVHDAQVDVMSGEGAGRAIEWKLPPLPTVMADLPMLRLAVRNLLSNAVKYTRPRGDTARIEVACAESRREIKIEVRDNGVGFDMRYADKLFGVFQRLHRMEDFEGTGIGLANVRRIVERHGGRVWADGRVDQGATFGFALPKTEDAGSI